MTKSFSAKDLCSRSCMQIRMFDLHPEKRPVPTINTEIGVTHQHQIALNTNNVIGEELRGTYINENICINFSNDIVCKDKIIEVKSVNREVEDWYFNSCVLQCALYKSLLLKSNKQLITAKFYSDLGNPIVKTTVDDNIKYILYFGEKKYNIIVVNPDLIIEFFVNKAKATFDWDLAKEFDLNYKFKEYETLKNYFYFELMA